MAEQVEIIDGLTPASIPATTESVSAAAFGEGHREAIEQLVQASGLGQSQRGDQARRRHQVGAWNAGRIV